MNTELEELAWQLGLKAPEHWRLRAELGLAFAGRVKHLLEEEGVIEVLAQGVRWQDNKGSADELDQLGMHASRLAASHPGSKSIDGTAHAAVSASYAVANALRGRPLQAADYAAYATVYAYAASAVTDPAAYRDEYAWQVTALRRLMTGTA